VALSFVAGLSLAGANRVSLTNDTTVDDLGNCSQCKRPLIEIDHYGERLIGCIECNRWCWPDSKRLFMVLPEDDLRALKESAKRRPRK